MRNLCLILSVLLWFLVEVHPQTYSYVSFMGNTLPNNSYVNLNHVGDDVSGNDSLQCHTDLETCCSSNEGPYRGHWFAPGSIESLSHDSNSYIMRVIVLNELTCVIERMVTCQLVHITMR